MRYRIETKSGKVYKAQEVELAFGFLTMKFWHGELRLPSGDISSIKKTYFASSARATQEKSPEATSGGLVVPVFLFILVFLFSLPILLTWVGS